MKPEHFVEWRCPIHGPLLDASCRAVVRCGGTHLGRRCNQRAVAFLGGSPVPKQTLADMRKRPLKRSG